MALADGKVMGQGPFGMYYYLSGALAGGICCSITHGMFHKNCFCDDVDLIS